LLGGQFSHAVTLQDQAMGVVNKPIEDRADHFVPVIDGELAGHDG
jgi:hypothetical protein